MHDTIKWRYVFQNVGNILSCKLHRKNIKEFEVVDDNVKTKL